MPPFTKGKKQLSKPEVDTAKQLSRVRIHAKRVIRLIRQKYNIFESTDSTLNINIIESVDSISSDERDSP